MPYPNEHAARLKEPGQFDRFARKVDAGGSGIDFIFGFKKEGGSEIQAVRFAKGKFTPAEARAWLKAHKMTPIDFEPASTEAGEISTDLSPDSRLMSWVPIAATGQFPQGDLSEEVFDEIVKNFNPAEHEPPVTLGHVTKEHNSKPAFAWIDGVKRVGNMLYAKAKQVSQELDDLLKSGRFKKRSIGLRLKDDGSHYLHHLAFLGSTAPAVKGLPDVYSDYIDESTEVNFEHEDDTLNFNRKGQEMEKTYSETELQALTAAAATNAATKAKADAEKEFGERETKIKKDAADAAAAETRKTVEKEFTEKATAIAATAAHKNDVDKFIDGAIKDGNLVPAQVPAARALLYAAEKKVELTYSEGEGEQKKEIKTDSFSALKSIITNFGEAPEGETTDTEHGSDRGGDEKAYSEEKDAAAKLMKDNPSWSYGQALKAARAAKK